MKFQLLLIVSIVAVSSYAQDIKTCSRKLKETFEKIEYYTNQRGKNEFAYDSISKSNEDFEKLLLYCTATYPETIALDFQDLTKIGLKISTSKNGLFRIYSWDTETGGTMRSFRNIFQFKSNKKVFSQKLLSDVDESGESSYSYEILDQVTSKNKIFYIVKSILIGSSAVSSHKIKIFAIENVKLNENAKLIKTKTGIKNELSYDIDFSSSVNQQSDTVDREYAWLKYDQKNKIIIIPLITNEGKLTKKKIRYQFKGDYFEKL